MYALRNLAFVTALIFVAEPTYAQITLDGCVDARGVPVQSIARPVNEVAIATLERGVPVIYYNTDVLRQFSEPTRLFWYAHECAHHVLGHHFGNIPTRREKEADCWAIATLRSRGLLSDDQLATVESEIGRLSGDGWIYLPGPQRKLLLHECADAVSSSERRGPESSSFCEGLETVISTADQLRLDTLAIEARTRQQQVEDEYLGEPANPQLRGARVCVIDDGDSYNCEFGAERMDREESSNLYHEILAKVDGCLSTQSGLWSKEVYEDDGAFYTEYRRGRRGTKVTVGDEDRSVFVSVEEEY